MRNAERQKGGSFSMNIYLFYGQTNPQHKSTHTKEDIQPFADDTTADTFLFLLTVKSNRHKNKLNSCEIMQIIILLYLTCSVYLWSMFEANYMVHDLELVAGFFTSCLRNMLFCFLAAEDWYHSFVCFLFCPLNKKATDGYLSLLQRLETGKQLPMKILHV